MRPSSKTSSSDRVLTELHPMNHRNRWRIGALASAVALLGSLATLQAHALVLGRITVQSALGESLRAEVDISDLSAEEASSLRIGVASVDVFKSAGLDYSAAAAGLDVKLQKRSDGRSYLRLSSNRAVTDPFVDLILEARWASGRVTRDYTMLFDPPNLRASGAGSAGIVTSAPVLSREIATKAAVSPRLEASVTTPRPPARVAAAAPRSATATVISPAEKIPGARQVVVKPGDNASKIAIQNKPANISLDQMLVALLRSNPEAFVGSNINLIKSGAVVQIPDEQAAKALSSGDAKQSLVAQSKDFNTFRRKLADNIPAAAQPGGADRQVSGKIQARVDDRGEAVASPDKLTLSKGAVQGVQSSNAVATDTANRLADPSKNNSGLTLPAAAPGGTASPPVLATSSPSSASNPIPGSTGVITAAPSAAVPLPNNVDVGAASGLPVVAIAQAPVASPLQPVPDANVAAAPQTPAVGQQSAIIAPAVTPQTTSPIDWIIVNSLLLGGGALLALLAAFGIVRYRKSQQSSQMDSSFLDSHLQPDSFFGASGGQRVDTNANNAGRSSIAYSPSQLDAAGDVDPVAEADVYLAYGRDQQAEDILKEALRTYPARIAIHIKLLEIFVKRRDHKAFESVAVTALKLCGGHGPDWKYITELGRQLEPSNSLYQSGVAPSYEPPPRNTFGSDPRVTAIAKDLPTAAPDSKTSLDLDLELGFAPDEAPAPTTMPALLTATTSNWSTLSATLQAGITPPSAFLDLDLNLDEAPAGAPLAESYLRSKLTNPATMPSSKIDFLAAGIEFTPEPAATRKAGAASPSLVSHDGMLEFDLNSLSLDLGPTILPAVAGLSEQQNDPLEVKFLLAEEFRILGDADGARSLADEVVAKAKGPLKFKAQAFLNTLP